MTVEEPALKKAKTDGAGAGDGDVSVADGWPSHTLNVNGAVDMPQRAKLMSELAAAPVEALKGLGDVSAQIVEHLGVNTVADLGELKFYHMAKSIVALADIEEEGGRPAGAKTNVDLAVDLEYEQKTLKEMAAAPVHALQGVSEEVAALLSDLGIKTVADLAEWKYCKWAESITFLAKYEHSKSAAERKQERLLSRLE